MNFKRNKKYWILKEETGNRELNFQNETEYLILLLLIVLIESQISSEYEEIE